MRGLPTKEGKNFFGSIGLTYSNTLLYELEISVKIIGRKEEYSLWFNMNQSSSVVEESC